MKIKEDVAVTFIIGNLSDRSLVAWREDERFRVLRELVTDGKPIAAAGAYIGSRERISQNAILQLRSLSPASQRQPPNGSATPGRAAHRG